MKKLNTFNVIELNDLEIAQTDGGTLAYDIGWLVHWAFRSGGGRNVAAIVEAGGVYAAHYAN